MISNTLDNVIAERHYCKIVSENKKCILYMKEL